MKANAPLPHSAYLSAILNLCAVMNRAVNGQPPPAAKPHPKKTGRRSRREARLTTTAS